MDEESLLSQRYMKFRVIGGFTEGEPVEQEKKRNMKKKEVVTSEAKADLEMEIQNLKEALKDKRKPQVITNEAIVKLRQEVAEEMKNASISMGLQEKVEALRMELSKSFSSPNQTPSPALKEKAERLVQEFKDNLSGPGSYMGLKQKLAFLSEINKQQDRNEKAKQLKEEINEKLNEQVKSKMEVLRKARDKVAKGEQLNDNEIEEVESAKEELREMLQSANLEVVTSGKKIIPTAPPGLDEKLAKADEVIKKEIEKAIDTAGVRGKIEELKAEIASASDMEKVEVLENEIKEQIAAAVDFAELKKKVESTLDLPSQETANAGNGPVELPVQETVGAGNSPE